MEMSALTFFSWEVMSALGWPFLVIGKGVLVADSDVVGTGGRPDGGGIAGSGRLGLTAGARGL